MRYIRDRTGRFEERPYYEQEELDQECEALVRDFLHAYRGEVRFPITTDALTLLVEQHARDLDCFADLSDEGPGVQGATYFVTGERPRVRIARVLMEQSWRENRLRTTLTHELGHVRFHRHLFEVEDQRLDLFNDPPDETSHTCHRDSIVDPPQSDWMEWQAAYASGALLMPRRPVNEMAAETIQEQGHRGRVGTGTQLAETLIQRTTDRFQVSDAAARVRLLQLGVITDEVVGDSLFG